MQGTVASFDEADRSGTVLLDDGHEIRFSGSAFDAARLRILRQGQRVRIDQDHKGEIVHVTLHTF